MLIFRTMADLTMHEGTFLRTLQAQSQHLQGGGQRLGQASAHGFIKDGSTVLMTSKPLGGFLFFFAQGEITRSIVAKHPGARFFYIGDGFNDFCASAQLSDRDYVFARKDHRLESLLLANTGEVWMPGKKNKTKTADGTHTGWATSDWQWSRSRRQTFDSDSCSQVKARWRSWADYTTLRRWLEELICERGESEGGQ